MSSFRTDVTDPRLHGPQHVGRYYPVPQDVFDGLFKFAGFTTRQRGMISQLGDQSIMVRKPALEIISLLKMTDFSRPVNRFVICEYSKFGSRQPTFVIVRVCVNRWTEWERLYLHIESCSSLCSP